MDAFLGSLSNGIIARRTPASSLPSRSVSIASTLSCITLNINAASSPSGSKSTNLDSDIAALASTPPTNFDDSSSSSISDLEAKTINTEQHQSQHHQLLSLDPTDIADLSKLSDVKTNQPKSVSIRDKVEVCDQLAQESIQVLNLDRSFDTSPGHASADNPIEEEFDASHGRTESFLGRASTAINKARSVLGKQTGELLGQARSEATYTGGRRSNLGARVTLSKKEPEAQPQAAIAESSQIKQKPALLSCAKRWLRHGLYVGQEQGFDPRIKSSGTKQAQETKDTKLASSSPKESLYSQPRKVLPLPTFAGKLLLEGERDYKMPFDVFNTLPSGQPKPDKWRKLQRNVFVGDAADNWKVSKKLEFSPCTCMPDSACDENCLNRSMFYECGSSNCNVGPGCGNRAFDDLRKRVKDGGKYNIGVEVTKTEKKGHGLRSCRMFDPGQIILEYTGEIITQKENDHRMRNRYKHKECFYLMMFDQGMIIDATRGSIGRFVNHSCEPNCKMVKWIVDGKPCMALFAGDGGIMTGEELTYDYNFDSFSAKTTQDCHCGMPACRGVLGPRSKYRERKGALKSIVTDSPTPNGGRTISSTPAAATKRKLKDTMNEVKKPGTGVAALLKQKGKALKKVSEEKELADSPAEQQQSRQGRPRGAATLQVTSKSAPKSKRVVAAKLTKKKTKVTTTRTVSSPSKPAKGNASTVSIRKAVIPIKGASKASKASKESKTSNASQAKSGAKTKVKSKITTKFKPTSKKATMTKPCVDIFEMPT